MKKLLSLIFTTLAINSLCAQETIIPKDTTKKFTTEAAAVITTLNVQDYLPQITPKSPNVAGIERYGAYPVSMFTGLPTIQIPIMDVNAGELKFPIYLTYHMGGNKVTDVANFVGLNWTLIYGASVTRQVKGLADETNAGLLGKIIPVNIQADLGATCYNEQVRSTMQSMAENQIDTERDLFSANLPKKSNQFILRDTTDYQWLNHDFSKIFYSKVPKTFQIKDEKGFQYFFDDKEVTNGSGITTWLIKNAQGSKPTDKIVFEYYPTTTQTRTHEIIESITIKDNGNGAVPAYTLNTGSLPGSDLISMSNSIDQKLPKTIFFPNGKINFVLETADRLDGNGKALDKIEIYSFKKSTQKYRLIKIVDLVYEYKNRQDNSPVLFLKEVITKDTLGADIGKYEFGYNTTNSLPSIQSKSRDYWGYYNGIGNSTLIPNQTIPLFIGTSQTSLTVTGGDRSSQEEPMKAWILNKITYPTGGTTEFEVEANQYYDGTTNKKAGGLRIKQIKSLPIVGGIPIIKYYKYGLNESGNGRLRDNLSLQYQTKQKIIYYNPGLPPTFLYSYDVRTITSNINAVLFPNEGSPVTYTYVTEYEDAGIGNNGKTIYKFRDANDTKIQLFNSAKYFVNSRHWDRGQLIEKRVIGADTKIKYKQVNTYNTIDNNSTTELGGRLIQGQTVYLNSRPYDVLNSSCYDTNDDYNPNQTYHIDFGITQQFKTEEYNYDDTDSTKYVYKKSELDYNAFYQPAEIRDFNSDGDIRMKRFRYVTDFNNLASNSLTGNALAYKNMKANNEIATPIEELSLRKYTDNSIRVLGGRLTKYKTFAFNSFNFTLPEFISFLEVPESPSVLIGSITLSDVNSSGNVINDSRYSQRINLTNYDANGNLSNYNVDNGGATAFTHSTTNIDGVYHSFPISETQNSGGNPSLTTTFYFDAPLLGLDSIMAPNGIKTKFEYDLFGRFLRAKDHNGKIIKEHAYNYGLGNNFSKEFIPRLEMTTLSGDYNNFTTISHYFEGLGRPIQAVQLSGSGDATKDIVSKATTYGQFGRPELSYVTFANAGAGALAPAPSPFDGDTAPYASVLSYDNSPLNRPKQEYGPGQMWRDSTKYISSRYLVPVADSLRKYTLTSNGANISGTWGNHQITKTVKITEKGNEVIEYKDNDGKLIQKDIQDGASSYISTAYIYDDFDILKYVVQPKLYEASTNFTETSNLIFGYKRDKRGRTVFKKVPDADPELFVFDKWDRLVMSQNALQKADGNRWKFHKYDALNREIMSGLKVSTTPHQTLQDEAMANNSFGEIRNTVEPFYTLNSTYPNVTNDFIYNVNYFDNYSDFKITTLNFLADESIHANYSGIANTNNALGLHVGTYTRNLINNNWLKTAHYYDNKLRQIQTKSTHHLSEANADVISRNFNFVGDIIWQKRIRKKDSKADLVEITENLLDHSSRLVGIKQTIDTTKTNLVSYEIDDIGRMKTKILGASAYAKTVSDGLWSSPTVWNRAIIPDSNSLVHIKHDIYLQRPTHAFASTIILGANFKIDTIAFLHLSSPKNRSQLLQKIDYSYHIRGGLLGINLDSAMAVSTVKEGDAFSYKLAYGFDGNITNQAWKHDNTPIRSYTLTYDRASRLKSASYLPNTENYSLSGIDYDKNSNIVKLQRYGKVDAAYPLIDDLTYNYVLNSNKLSTITDQNTVNNTVDFVPRGNKTYSYLADGSLNSDENERISSTSYNSFLKQPTQISLNYSSRRIEQKFDGAGNLIRTEYWDNGTRTEYWDYVDGLIYKNGNMFSLANPEGRAYFENNKWNYEYFITDHLGNVRSSFTAINNQITGKSQNDFDPLGNRNSTGTVNPVSSRFELQNHEKDLTFGLNRVNFGARSYNPTIGRFNEIDDFTSKRNWLSPYNMVQNSFLNRIDPDGNEDLPELIARILNYFGFNSGYKPKSKEEAAEMGRRKDQLNSMKREAEAIEKRFDEGLSPIPLIGSSYNISKSVAKGDNLGITLATVGFAVDASGVMGAEGAIIKEGLPSLDATGKVHGLLPKVQDFAKFSKEELVQLLKELRQSVEKRIEVTSKLGRDRAHGQRQGAEQDLIKSLEKYLSK